MTPEQKRSAYQSALKELKAVLDGQHDVISAYSTCASILHARLPIASWVGFYRVVAPRLLRVGPYQGPLGCLEIPFERGVCGAAARDERTLIVPDVEAFPGHIACDAAARSEIVVPVRGPDGRLAAVLDLDSHQPAAFDEVDREGLEAIAAALTPALAG